MRSTGWPSASSQCAPFQPVRTSRSAPSAITAAHAVRLHIGTVGHTDLALDDRDPVQRLSLLLIRDLEDPKRSAGRSKALWIRHRPLSFLAWRPAFGTVVASMMRISRPRAVLGTAPASARPTRNASQSPHRRRRYSRATLERSTSPTDAGPCRRRPQAPLAQAISQDHAQQVDRSLDGTRAPERTRLARARLQRLSPAQSPDDLVPVPIEK